MSTGWTKQMVRSVIVGGILFVFLCVVNKLYLGRTDWLVRSATWSLAWVVGHFIANIFAEMNATLWRTIIIDAGIIFLTFLIIAFILGVVLCIADWNDITNTVMIPFGLSIIGHSKWIQD